MAEWFSEETSRQFVYVALLALFAVLGPVAERGRGRRLIMTIWLVLVALGVAALLAAGAAWWLGQPGYVVRPLAVSGIVVTLVFGGMYGTLNRAYQSAELRTMAARDL